MTEREALKLVYENSTEHDWPEDIWNAIKEALAQQCFCGEPNSAGTHRTDGPCLAPQPEQIPPSVHSNTHQPEQEQIQPDKVCIEDDGCPTEKAVLQRFWREHQKTQPEPVATVAEVHMSRYTIEWTSGSLPEGTKLYTTPPQRTWVGLTDEERNDCLVSADPCEALAEPEARQLMEDIEAKLKQKNGYDS